MLTLGIDTSFYYLNLVLIQDNQTIDAVYEKCYRNQSEVIFERIDELFRRNQLANDSLDSMVITIGPGSYTGVRIAMSIAKVYCSLKKIPLYGVSTLQLYAGLAPTIVMLDARSERCFFSIYNNGIALVDDCIMETNRVSDCVKQYPEFSIYGDGHLLGKTDNFTDISENYLLLKDCWQLIDNIDLLTPNYLKDQSAYGNDS